MVTATNIKLFDNICNIPSPFEGPHVIGHEKIKNCLLKYLNKEQFSAAFLFEGIKGIGKMKLALEFSWNLLNNNLQENWQNIDFNSNLYKQIYANIYPNLLYVTRQYNIKQENFQQAILIQDIRNIKKFLYKTSSNNNWRIIIIDSINDLNYAAENALLKILEEPPEKTLFILICHERAGALDTTRSRCHTFRFLPLTNNDIYLILQQLQLQTFFDYPTNIQQKLLSIANGSVRDIIIFSNDDNLKILETIDDIFSSSKLNFNKIMLLINKLFEENNLLKYNLAINYLKYILNIRAKKYIQINNLTQADLISKLWFKLQQNILNTNIYNLDKKQTILLTIEEIHNCFYNIKNY
ncbi:hypothetical protein [Bartonella sp. DGB1]|uniref:hypothetical protein n=1 Tax=Bartonella sp. DGB1 TaxID=3239807 RepID=UPI0035265DCC